MMKSRIVFAIIPQCLFVLTMKRNEYGYFISCLFQNFAGSSFLVTNLHLLAHDFIAVTPPRIQYLYSSNCNTNKKGLRTPNSTSHTFTTHRQRFHHRNQFFQIKTNMVNWTTPLAATLTFWAVLSFWVLQAWYRERAETQYRQKLAVEWCGDGGGEVRVSAGEGTGPTTTTVMCMQPQGTAQ